MTTTDTTDTAAPRTDPPVRVGQTAPFTLDDLRGWLAGLGVEFRNIRRLEFVTRSGVPRDVEGREAASVWLRVDQICRDESGHPFLVFEQGQRRMATELLLIPVSDLPRPADV